MAASAAPPSSPAARSGTRLLLVATTFPLASNEEVAQPGFFEALCARVRDAGYGGLDMSVLQILLVGKARVAAALAAHGLRLVAKCYSSGGGCPTGVAAAGRNVRARKCARKAAADNSHMALIADTCAKRRPVGPEGRGNLSFPGTCGCM